MRTRYRSVSFLHTAGRIAIGIIALTLWSCTPSTPVTTAVSEINPDQSSLDSSDADGASGGRVNGLAVNPTGTTLYAASEWGGVYKSTDSGLNWAYLPGHRPTAAWDVEVDPDYNKRIYATSLYDGRVNSLAGINISTDAGTTWAHPASSIPPESFCADPNARNEPSAFGISIDPDDSSNVYIGTNCGLAISTDRGNSWRYVDPTPGDLADTIWSVTVHDGGIIDLCGNDGHQRSTDGGNIWSTASGAGLPSGRCSISVSPDEAYVLFAVVGTTIYESDDGGQTWPTILTNPNPQGRIPFVTTNQRSGSGYDLWFGDVQLHRTRCTTPANPGPGGTARCPTNNWTGPFTRASGAHDDTGDLVFDPSATTNACPLALSSDGGVYYNTRSSSPACHSPAWEQPDVTPHALWLFGMAGVNQSSATGEDLYFVNQDTGTFFSSNAGAANPTWMNRGCCDGFDVAADASEVLNTNCCWNVGRANRLFLRSPGMTGGGQVNTYPPGNGNIAGFRAIDVLDRFGPDDYVIVMTNGVFATTNINVNPINWGQALGGNGAPPGICNVKASGPTNNPTFYAQAQNCNNQNPNRPRQLWSYTGTNPGGNWTRISPPGNVGGIGVYDVDPNNPNRIFASHLQFGTANPQMILSHDGGATWTNLNALDSLMTGNGNFNYRTRIGPTNFTSFNGYPQPTLVAFDPDDQSVLVAGGHDSGVFASVDGGTNWILLTDPVNSDSSGIPHVPRPQFAHFDHLGTFVPSGPTTAENVHVYIGTKGRGVWRFTIQVPQPMVVAACKDMAACSRAIPEPDRLILECTDAPCAFIDPLPKNCLVKFACPGCEDGLCPPVYHVAFDGLDPRLWDVQLYTGEGKPVDMELQETDTGVVLSFQPSEELYLDGLIGDYFLAFRMTPEAKAGTYEFDAYLRTSD
jgi:hypothetical protein